MIKYVITCLFLLLVSHHGTYVVSLCFYICVVCHLTSVYLNFVFFRLVNFSIQLNEVLQHNKGNWSQVNLASLHWRALYWNRYKDCSG